MAYYHIKFELINNNQLSTNNYKTTS